MRSQHTEVPFDYRRHFGEIIRQFLPLLVVVSALVMVVVIVWGPGASPPDPETAGPDPRVGLLPVAPVETAATAASAADAPADPGAGGGLPFDAAFVVPRPLDLARAPQSPRFDAPMGSVSGALTYNAQPFLTTRHLGDDLNGIGGWDSDLGDPVYAAGDGEVVYAGWPSDGWGNVVILLHRLPGGEAVTTFYGHLDAIAVPVGVTVRRGDRIGSVGKADGRYLAHLHFEVRSAASLAPGNGYGDVPLGRRSGEAFLARHRGAADDRQNGPLGGPWDTRLPAARRAAEGGGSLQIETRAPETPERP